MPEYIKLNESPLRWKFFPGEFGEIVGFEYNGRVYDEADFWDVSHVTETYPGFINKIRAIAVIDGNSVQYEEPIFIQDIWPDYLNIYKRKEV